MAPPDMKALSRRYFFLGSLGFGMSCSRSVDRRRFPYSASRVSIIRASSYSVELFDIVRRVLIDHQVVVADKNIVLKPNLVEFDPHAPINTHPVFVAAVADAFQSLGARTVRIAEGPGHRRMTLDMAQGAGFFDAVSRFEDRFTDLNLDDVSRVRLTRPFSTLKELYLPNTALRADLLVSLPKMKTHHWAGATLAMKNLFGVVPGSVYGWPKNPLHWAGIDESIADLHYLFPKQFCLVDGIQGMEGNGPILGSIKHAGVIVAGHHPPSVDAICCQIMRIDPAKIKYLRMVAERSGSDLARIEQTGESVKSVETQFALHPDLSHLRLT
jgi:uncharacterized protein (DUF362 family)